MTADPFGTTPDGQPFRRVDISGGGLAASFMTWGASLVDLRLSGHPAPLVLGFKNFKDYLEGPLYFGAVCGRYANRIAHGRFSVDGERYQTDLNDHDRHTLHGGAEGTAARNWTLAAQGGDFARFEIVDPAGHMGFPGTLSAIVTYRLAAHATLSVEIEAHTDAPTLCGFALHPYFNLDDGGAGTIRSHRLMIAASAYLPVDAEKMPTGEVRPVAGTSFDFGIARALSPTGGPVAFDHGFCLASAPTPLRLAAWLQGAASGLEMEVWTTEPGLQLFTARGLSCGAPGLGGRRYGSNAGLCLEPQAWPDSPNHPHFPQAVLRPGETYRQRTQYRFRAAP